MANGENAEKNGKIGFEYWKSRLHKMGEIPGKITKILTHRKERRDAKKNIKKEIESC